VYIPGELIMDVVADSAAVMQIAIIHRMIARRLEDGDLSVIPRAVSALDNTADQLEFMADALATRGRIVAGKVDN
jgi:hypothetical protein